MSLLQRRRCSQCGEPVDGKARSCPHCGAALGQKGGAKDQVEKDFDDILQSIIEGPRAPEGKESKELDEEFRDLELEGIPPPSPPKPAPAPVTRQPAPEPKQEASPPQEAPPREDLLTYECPACGAHVAEDSTKCPSCGAIFNGSDQFDCPVCGSAVAFEAVQCPKCGVRFVEDRTPVPLAREPTLAEENARTYVEVPPAAAPFTTPEPLARPGTSPSRPIPRVERASPVAPEKTRIVTGPIGPYPTQPEPAGPFVGQRELSALVAEVKAFIVLGKRFNLTFGNAADTILKATELAKRREIAAAMSLLGQARDTLLQAYREQARQRLEAYTRSSQGIPTLASRLQGAQRALASGDLEGALALLDQVASQLAARDPRALETRRVLDETTALLEQSAALGFDGSAVQEMLRRSRATLARGDIATAHGLALQGRDRALAILKEGLAEELKGAKDRIFEMKLKGQRLEKPMEIIKRASMHFKQDEFAAAARELRALRQELARY